MDELISRTSQLMLKTVASFSSEPSGVIAAEVESNSMIGKEAPGKPDAKNERDEDIISADVEKSSSSSGMSASYEDSSWIGWFVGLRGNEFFCNVDEEYIQDDFNLTGLNTLVPYYDYALDMILDIEIPSGQNLTENQQEVVESAAEMLYGLIHARFILTTRGMQIMLKKFESGDFGDCPRIFCQGQNILPVGLSDAPRSCTVALFCPRCHDIFHPKNQRQASIDGAYFGTTFAHIFLLTHPEIIPRRCAETYVPRIYGFKIHQDSVYYQNNLRKEKNEVRPDSNCEDKKTINNAEG